MRALVVELIEPRSLMDFCPVVPGGAAGRGGCCSFCRCVDLYRCVGTVPWVGCRA